MQLNILVQGQSNAQYLLTLGYGAQLAATVEAMLGFDGIANRINLLGSPSVSAIPNTAMIPGVLQPNQSWLLSAPAGSASDWVDGPEQAALTGYLAALPAEERAAPTAIVWLHNESDSLDPAITPAEWASAVGFALGEDRAALGQAAGTTPANLVSVPYDEGRSGLEATWQGGSAQALKLGDALLVAEPAQNATIGAQIGDSNMDLTDAVGGQHLDPTDLAQLVARLAPSIAVQFAAYALPGSPVAIGAVLDTAGPQAVSAALVAGAADQVVVQLSLPAGATDLAPLSAAAALGAGWSVRSGAGTLYASSATLLAGNRLALGFAGAVPDDGSGVLYYGYGSGRIFVQTGPLTAASVQAAGQDAAVYDSTGLPLWEAASGLPLGLSGDRYTPVQTSGPVAVTGSSGNETITAGDAAVSVIAGNGALEVDNGGSTTTVLAGPAATTVRGGTGSVVVQGGSGSLVAAAGLTGHDSIMAGSGAALIVGSHDDAIVGGSGEDTIFTGGGLNDVQLGSGVSSFTGGDGSDTVSLGSGTATAFLGNGTETALGGSGQATVSAGSGTDLVTGGSGTLAFYGGAGSDTAVGGSAGGNTLVGGSGTSTLVGAHDDHVVGGSGTTEAWLGAGTNVVLGAGGSLVATSGGGNDDVFGGAGALTYLGGAGTDIVTGGTTGSSAIVVAGPGVTDVFAGLGNEQIWGNAAATASLYFLGGDVGAMVVGGGGSNQITAGSGSDVIFSGPGATTVAAGSGAPLVVAGAASGTTLLVAGVGDATLYAGGASVTYESDDTPLGGTDVLIGMRPGLDHIRLNGFAAGAVDTSLATASIAAWGTAIGLPDGKQLLLTGIVAPDQLSALFH